MIHRTVKLRFFFAFSYCDNIICGINLILDEKSDSSRIEILFAFFFPPLFTPSHSHTGSQSWSYNAGRQTAKIVFCKPDRKKWIPGVYLVRQSESLFSEENRVCAATIHYPSITQNPTALHHLNTTLTCSFTVFVTSFVNCQMHKLSCDRIFSLYVFLFILQ